MIFISNKYINYKLMNIKLLLKNNLLIITSLIIFSLILGRPNYIFSLLTLGVCILGSFCLHYLSHFNIPIYDYITKLHIDYHHNTKNKNLYLDIIIEFIINFFIYGSVLLYLIINYLYPQQKVFIGSIVYMYALFYTSIHLINYTIFKNKTHQLHHIKHNNSKICNLGPDFMDHIFLTPCKYNVFENNNIYLINLVTIVILMYIVKMKK